MRNKKTEKMRTNGIKDIRQKNERDRDKEKKTRGSGKETGQEEALKVSFTVRINNLCQLAV